MKYNRLAISIALLMSMTSVPAQATTATAELTPSRDTLLATAQYDVRDNLVGTWRRTYVGRVASANLCITKGKAPNSLYVRLRAFNGANSGLIEGNATLLDEDGYSAVMTINNMGKTGEFKMIMAQTGISAEYSGDPAALGLDHGITINGVYVKGEPKYINEVDPKRAFLNQANLDKAFKLVGSRNMLSLIDVLTNGAVVEDEPGRYSGFIPGAGIDAQIRATSDGRLYVFGRGVFSGNNDQVFFTNDKDYAHKLPSWVDHYGEPTEVTIICK